MVVSVTRPKPEPTSFTQAAAVSGQFCSPGAMDTTSSYEPVPPTLLIITFVISSAVASTDPSVTVPGTARCVGNNDVHLILQYDHT